MIGNPDQQLDVLENYSCQDNVPYSCQALAQMPSIGRELVPISRSVPNGTKFFLFPTQEFSEILNLEKPDYGDTTTRDPWHI